METTVRMGEAAVSRTVGDTLACIGLGSCIGLALIDRASGVAGLAHVMLPAAPSPDPPQPGKFADLAAPALVDLVIAIGAVRSRLEAVMVGGSAMFAMSGSQDIGGRNATAVAEALAALRIPVRAQDTGGNRGRTIRIVVSQDMRTTVREAGGQDQQIFGTGTPSRPMVAA
jgi:chemotaxis protein CheD